MLKIEHLFGGYHEKEVLKDISFGIENGQFLCILGANGCGKTTLLKNILGFLKPTAGEVSYLGKNIHHMKEKEIAKHIAYIPQAHTPPFPYTVFDVVLMGRTPYLRGMSNPTKEDEAAVQKILDDLDLNFSQDERYTELSGGERQLVIIARALAQEPDILIMDEPTASLDFGNQYHVLRKMKELSKSGLGVIMVTHNPEHALYCSDQTIIMNEGHIVEMGLTKEVVSEENLETIYGIKMKITEITLENGSTFFACTPSF